MVGRQRYVIAHYRQQERYDRCQKYRMKIIVGNGQKMKCKLKGSVNMNMRGG